jgi:hypothetical protein
MHTIRTYTTQQHQQWVPKRVERVAGPESMRRLKRHKLQSKRRITGDGSSSKPITLMTMARSKW